MQNRSALEWNEKAREKLSQKNIRAFEICFGICNKIMILSCIASSHWMLARSFPVTAMSVAKVFSAIMRMLWSWRSCQRYRQKPCFLVHDLSLFVEGWRKSIWIRGVTFRAKKSMARWKRSLTPLQNIHIWRTKVAGSTLTLFSLMTSSMRLEATLPSETKCAYIASVGTMISVSSCSCEKNSQEVRLEQCWTVKCMRENSAVRWNRTKATKYSVTQAQHWGVICM